MASPSKRNKFAAIVLALLSGGASYVFFLPDRAQGNSSDTPASHSGDGSAQQPGSEGTPQAGARNGNGKGNPRRTEKDQTVHAGPQYRLFRDDGKINGELLTLAGIDPSRADEVQELMDRWWKKLSEEIDSKRELVEAESNPKERIFSYVVKGDPELAEARKKQLAEELEMQFGAGAARILVPYIASPKHFAGLGYGTLKIKIQPIMNWGEELTSAQYSVVDPKSGKRLLTGGTTDPDLYAAKFGNAFKRND